MDCGEQEIENREQGTENSRGIATGGGTDLYSLLSAFSSRFAPLEAQLLAAHVLGKPRSWVLAHPEARLTPEEQATLDTAAARLEHGEPLPYILGHWEFYGLDFLVTPAVLIPRPETELLVETALQHLAIHNPQSRILDVGTGSGCIAVSIAVHCPQVAVIATDLSAEALAVARCNAERHRVADRFQFVHADLLPIPLPPGPFDLILANLPYIPTATLHGLEVYGKEPTLALDGGNDGLDVIGRLLEKAPPLLAPGSCLLLEIEATQGESASRLARRHFPQAEIRVIPDLAGRDRVVSIRT